VTLANGNANSLALPKYLASGSYTVTAIYSGDTNFNSSTNTLTQIVHQASSALTLGSLSNPSVFGQSGVLFTATVASESGTPRNGTVQFTTNGANFGAAVPLTSGSANSAALPKYLASGSYTVTAVYSGDTNFITSTSTLTQTVSQAGSAVTVASSSSPSLFGQSGVTFTATVASESGTPRYGTVQFTTNGVNFGGAVTLASDSATSVALPKYLPTGSYLVTAVYSGDTNFSTSTSATITQTVNQAGSAVAIASSSPTSVYGQSVVTIVATVSNSWGGTPRAGTVQFTTNGMNYGGSVILTGGMASVALPKYLPAGSYAVTAVYSGDTNFGTSTSPTITQTVNQASSALAVTSSANPSIYGQNAVTIMATVTSASGTPRHGTVQFSTNGVPFGAPVTIATGSASVALSKYLPAGGYAVTAAYSGDANFSMSTSGSLMQTVTVAFIPTATPVLYVVGNPPVFIDTNASVADGSNLNFGGASLTVTIVTNAATNDVLGIKSQGNGFNQIGVQAATIEDGGSPIATFSGGNDLNPLVFLFNTNATAQSVTALMRQLTFATANTNTNSRVVQMALTVGGSTVLAQYTFTLDRPPVTSNTFITAALGQTIEIAFSQVLTNDSDADGDTLTIGDFSELTAYGGWVTTNSTSFTYAPPGGLTNQDRFSYLVEDGRGGTCVGSIIINFVPVNQIHIDASKIAGTGAELTMAGIPGNVYQIQASTNLVNWINLSTVTADGAGLIQVLDAAAKNYPQRFYRAIAR